MAFQEAPLRPMTQPMEIKRVIKLGGAAITYKGSFESPNHEVIRRVAQHLAEAYRINLDGKGCQHQDATRSRAGLIVVHGAGSFGHHQAVKYSVSKGWSDYGDDSGAAGQSKYQGFVATRASVAKLNCMVVDALISEGLPAVGMSPFTSGWTTSGKVVVTDGCDAISACLSAGLLPVIHGDCVLDSHLGCTILSGDTIVRRICERYKVESAAFLTNVAGVFDRPPEENGAGLVREISVKPDGSWTIPGIKLLSSSHDATGGIAKKIEEASVIAALGVDVAIALAGSSAGRLACLEGPGQLWNQHEWEGTCVTCKLV